MQVLRHVGKAAIAPVGNLDFLPQPQQLHHFRQDFLDDARCHAVLIRAGKRHIIAQYAHPQHIVLRHPLLFSCRQGC